MGNGTEEDYNFVFKGKLEFVKKEGAWHRPRRRPTELASPALLFLSYQDPPGLIIPLYKKESCKDGGGSGYWSESQKALPL